VRGPSVRPKDPKEWKEEEPKPSNGPGPGGSWKSNTECSGAKLETFEKDITRFKDGEWQCRNVGAIKYPGKILCCRCDRGDGVERTDSCWL